ncbi:hypothetical protein BJ508DRAFT_313350 [Ascobolus immersus RN42]|uniref:Uncharacterized protein n=1 Tax=Ascobolus immersus RN42 TaxID=1160509 RepID=A0A3N4HIY9_ASCIM|nr:hypothetical protein BJ508DRAFT_313350 [Ascobolus immersus RN42]
MYPPIQLCRDGAISLDRFQNAVAKLIRCTIELYDFPVPLEERNGNETYRDKMARALADLLQLRLPAATLARIRKRNEEKEVEQFMLFDLLRVKTDFRKGRYWEGLCKLYPELADEVKFE